MVDEFHLLIILIARVQIITRLRMELSGHLMMLDPLHKVPVFHILNQPLVLHLVLQIRQKRSELLEFAHLAQ